MSSREDKVQLVIRRVLSLFDTVRALASPPAQNWPSHRK